MREGCTYAIGDIQGCFASLQALLGQIDYRPTRDRLLLAGDLVNRGPRSLDVLRWAREQPLLEWVLGNHEMHLLCVAAGVAKSRRKDTFEAICAAEDADELLGWLRQQALLVRRGEHVLVHAGLHPAWSIEQAEAIAREIENELRGPRWKQLLGSWRTNEKRSGWAEQWHDDLVGTERLATALNAFTRMRCLRADGSMSFEFAGPPEECSSNLAPWYDMRQWPATILFGHWAALGFRRGPPREGGKLAWVGLDSGCVWGASLTAFRLDDGVVFQQPAIDRR